MDRIPIEQLMFSVYGRSSEKYRDRRSHLTDGSGGPVLSGVPYEPLDALWRGVHNRRRAGALPAVLAGHVVGDIRLVDVFEAGVDIDRCDEPTGDVVEEQLVD